MLPSSGPLPRLCACPLSWILRSRRKTQRRTRALFPTRSSPTMHSTLCWRRQREPLPVARTLSVLSEGCGLGEFFGRADRGSDGKQCICGPSYFLPLKEECRKCPERESVCDEIGLGTPISRKVSGELTPRAGTWTRLASTSVPTRALARRKHVYRTMQRRPRQCVPDLRDMRRRICSLQPALHLVPVSTRKTAAIYRSRSFGVDFCHRAVILSRRDQVSHQTRQLERRGGGRRPSAAPSGQTAGPEQDVTVAEFQKLLAAQENMYLTASQVALLFRNVSAAGTQRREGKKRTSRPSGGVVTAVSTTEIKAYLGGDEVTTVAGSTAAKSSINFVLPESPEERTRHRNREKAVQATIDQTSRRKRQDCTH